MQIRRSLDEARWFARGAVGTTARRQRMLTTPAESKKDIPRTFEHVHMSMGAQDGDGDGRY